MSLQNREFLKLEIFDQFAVCLNNKVVELRKKQTSLINYKVKSIEKVAEKTLANISKICESLEIEIRLCDFAKAERSKDMDALSVQLSEFEKSHTTLLPLPSLALTNLHTQLKTSIEQLEREVTLSIEAFLEKLTSEAMFPNLDRVRIVEHTELAVPAHSFVLSSEQNTSPRVNGVAQKEDSDKQTKAIHQRSCHWI